MKRFLSPKATRVNRMSRCFPVSQSRLCLVARITLSHPDCEVSLRGVMMASTTR